MNHDSWDSQKLFFQEVHELKENNGSLRQQLQESQRIIEEHGEVCTQQTFLYCSYDLDLCQSP